MNLSPQDYQKVITLLSHLGILEDQISIVEDNDTITISVDVDEQEAGIYIGRFAGTLDSLQFLLSLFLRSDQIHHVHLDIGGYRERREQILRDMAARIADSVLTTGLPRALPPLSSTERRQVHLMYQDHDQLETYSEGEGYRRRLFLAPKNS